jgi:hypothetical protein
MADTKILKMADDTRWQEFARFRETVSWVSLRRHLDQMPGGELVDLACDRMNESALIFTYAGQRFGVDLSDDGFRFRLEDSSMPESTLADVIAYASKILGPQVASSPD